MGLTGKRILFIAPIYFGIAEKIQKSLIDKGVIVDFYDERPDNTFFTKAFIRINRNIIGRHIDRYYDAIIEETKDRRYDFIFFIKGEAISLNQLERLLKLHPESKSVIYHWDSIARNNNALNILNCFDRRFSFDRKDCQSFDMTFLPLFYYDEYSSIADVPDSYDYSLLFVGTAHSDRYKIIKSLTRQLTQMDKRVFSYFYFQGKVMFWKYLIQNKESRDIDKDAVHFKPISEEQLRNLYHKSKVVADINHPMQTGLTLRCIETLGSKRKLITTNADIVNYDFYNPNNILVIDRKNPIITKEFLEIPFIPIADEIYMKYSLTNWLNTIFH